MKISDIYAGDHVAYNGKFATVVSVDVPANCVALSVRNKGTQYCTTFWAEPSELRKIQTAPIDETNASADWITDSFFDSYLVHPYSQNMILGFRNSIPYKAEVFHTSVGITCVDPIVTENETCLTDIIDSLFEEILEEDMCVDVRYTFDYLNQSTLSITFYNIIEE